MLKTDAAEVQPPICIRLVRRLYTCCVSATRGELTVALFKKSLQPD